MYVYTLEMYVYTLEMYVYKLEMYFKTKRFKAIFSEREQNETFLIDFQTL